MLQEKLNIFLRVPVSVSRILRFIALIKSKLNIGMRNVSDKEEKNNPDRSSTMMHYSPEILDVDLVLIII